MLGERGPRNSWGPTTFLPRGAANGLRGAPAARPKTGAEKLREKLTMPKAGSIKSLVRQPPWI